MKFSAFIFDFDGVLFDSELLHLKACNDVFKNYNILVEENDYFEKYSGLSDKELFPLIFAEQGHASPSDIFLKKLLSEKTSSYKKIINSHSSLPSRPGMLHFLKKLHLSNIKLAICSNAMREEIDVVLESLEEGHIKNYFTTITSIEEVGKGKPYPEGYLHTCNKLQVKPNQCLVLEDTPNGIRAAKSAGMYVIGLTGTHPKIKLTDANLIVDELKQIEALI